MDFSKFEKENGLNFANKELLRQAFVHRSYINENPNLGISHNERLEFLGDAVLELVVTEYLYKTYPKKTEGEMTALRAALVNANTLAAVAADIGTEGFMLLSKGEAKSLPSAKQASSTKAGQYILANAFEAIVGAIYIDSDYETVSVFLKKNLLPKIKNIIEKKLWIDAKSFFQEKAQEIDGITPEYRVTKEVGPDHEKRFTMGVFLGDEKVAEGEGMSKQEAEQDAAREALSKKGWE
ncbi:MAG: ribonuclease III [Candidatus Terrybacteria bacterium CG10_big_fil_rev_8_21_14_0_10_41_10]|uniref:Ribonuclease 3 n=1 Tax=Candidatus Terrybacteria bacterium CG10_big_fil_rev_8_21_14_0_10_41_10 TaxID=1975026 RepID=A0A2M8LAI3_9BACT|nr:MAG: ribonuclease III [Candidatus Terrybacteria bacterium CG10_big_fil_rev_8_21_14_0_10_41_10]